MFGKKKWLPVVAVGLLAAAVALVGALALPQAASAAPAAGRGGPGMGGGSNDTLLAEALGITVEKLTTARQEAYQAGIQEALDKGLITQAQADKLKAGTRGLRGFGGLIDSQEIDQEALLAKALGITVEQLQAAQQKAQDASIAQAITDGKLTQEQADTMKARSALQKFIQDNGLFKSIVEQAVKAGIITQAQADSILSDAGDGGMFFGKGDFGGRGGHGMRGGFGGRGDAAPQGTPAPTGASATSAM